MKTLICLRGLPGSGKTTVAQSFGASLVCSADDFFMVPGVGYRFDVSRLSEAHGHCFRRAFEAIRHGLTLVVVDNTNLTAWQVSPYALMAQAYGYDFKVVTVECDPAVAFGRQTHGVPLAGFERMVEDYRRRDLLPWWQHVVTTSSGAMVGK